MVLVQKRFHHRRIPDEKIADYVHHIDFDQPEPVWLKQFETVFRSILSYEYYLSEIPDNLGHPKYRTIAVRTIYRMLCQVPSGHLPFTGTIDPPDPLLSRILDYIRAAELNRRERLYAKFPNTPRKLSPILRRLKDNLEI